MGVHNLLSAFVVVCICCFVCWYLLSCWLVFFVLFVGICCFVCWYLLFSFLVFVVLFVCICGNRETRRKTTLTLGERKSGKDTKAPTLFSALRSPKWLMSTLSACLDPVEEPILAAHTLKTIRVQNLSLLPSCFCISSSSPPSTYCLPPKNVSTVFPTSPSLIMLVHAPQDLVEEPQPHPLLST